jgi:hypothetical protein
MATESGGISFVTTLPAPTTARSPMVTPLSTAYVLKTHTRRSRAAPFSGSLNPFEWLNRLKG